MPTKYKFFLKFYAYSFLKVHLHHFSKIKSHKEVTNSRKYTSRSFFIFFLLMEGSGSGAVVGSGSGAVVGSGSGTLLNTVSQMQQNQSNRVKNKEKSREFSSAPQNFRNPWNTLEENWNERQGWEESCSSGKTVYKYADCVNRRWYYTELWLEKERGGHIDASVASTLETVK